MWPRGATREAQSGFIPHLSLVPPLRTKQASTVKRHGIWLRRGCYAARAARAAEPSSRCAGTARLEQAPPRALPFAARLSVPCALPASAGFGRSYSVSHIPAASTASTRTGSPCHATPPGAPVTGVRSEESPDGIIPRRDVGPRVERTDSRGTERRPCPHVRGARPSTPPSCTCTTKRPQRLRVAGHNLAWRSRLIAYLYRRNHGASATPQCRAEPHTPSAAEQEPSGIAHRTQTHTHTCRALPHSYIYRETLCTQVQHENRAGVMAAIQSRIAKPYRQADTTQQYVQQRGGRHTKQRRSGARGSGGRLAGSRPRGPRAARDQRAGCRC